MKTKTQDRPDEDARGASVDPQEIARFSAIAAEWWDPNGKFRPLHTFNPARLTYIRDLAIARFGREAASLKPFEGLSLLDIGCGGGLLAEPMARLGFAVTGIDAAERNVRTARVHADEQGLAIDYRVTTAEDLAAGGARFDVVLNMEVVEHVADLAGFLAASSACVKPGGIMIVATLNRTLKSFALAKVGAEYVLGWLPRGTHDWAKFVTPSELRDLVTANGLTVHDVRGVSYNPFADRWSLSRDTAVNYMIAFVRD